MNPARLQSLDVLRGIAILLVLFRHQGYFTFLSKVGWIGVDLFFVLSGFLVSSLFFKEFKETGTVNPARFLIRRGFKIYPLYYLLILLFLVQAAFRVNLLDDTDIRFRPKMFIGQFLFIQNYFQLRLGPTWSLAVEEHFYIILAIGFWMAQKIKGFINSFALPGWCFGFICLVWVLRVWEPFIFPAQWCARFYTHNCMDTLFLGVIIGWIACFKPELIKKLATNYRLVLLYFSLVPLFLAGYFNELSPFFKWGGYNLLAIGFAAAVILFTYNPTFEKPNRVNRVIAGPFAFIGFYSYSIYLAHIIFLDFKLEKYFAWFGLTNLISLPYILFYLAGSLGLGILAGKFIEKPFLNLRNRLVP